MDYTATAKSTAAEIRAAGVAMTLRVTTPGEYDPETGAESGAVVTDYASFAVLTNPGFKDSGVTFQDGSLVRAGDKVALVAAYGLAVVPKSGDAMLISGQAWSVGPVQTTNPGGVDIMHKCFLRRA